MDGSIEKFKTQLHLFTPNEQIEIINNRINTLEKMKKEQTLRIELMESTLNAMKNKLIWENEKI